jgi:hypothetical protein
MKYKNIFYILSTALLTSCGGGGGGNDAASKTNATQLVSCATNPTATITGTVDELKIPFASQVLTGRICVTGSGCANHTALTINADGLTGSVSGGAYRFTIGAICKNSSYPNDLFVSGDWSDGTVFENATFTPSTITIRYMTLPAASGYFYM